MRGTGLSFFGFIPQAYRTIANRDTLKDISLASQAIYSVCLASSTTYSYLNSIWFTAACARQLRGLYIFTFI